MKFHYQLLLAASLSAAVLLGPVSEIADAVTVQEIPNPRNSNGWVSDRANIISPETEARLNQKLSELETQTGDEIAIVTVEDTAGFASPKAFATDLFNFWGIGKAAEDNGVLFLVSVGDRRSEVEVGYGLASVLTQTKIEDLLAREAVPDFKQSQYDAGIEKATAALMAELEGVAVGAASGSDYPGSSAPVQLAERSSFSQYSTGMKLFFFGSGAIAILFYRYGRAAFEAPVALAPGSNKTFTIGSDPQQLRVQLASILPVAIGGFGVGGMVSMLWGAGPPVLGGLVMGLPLAALSAFFRTRKQVGSLFCCDRCKTGLIKASDRETTEQLSKAQRVAEEIGSTTYTGWKCPTCKGMAVRGNYTFSRYELCPRCQERTIEKNLDKTPATYQRSGKIRTHRSCYCCDYTDSQVQSIAQLTHTHHHSSSSSSGFSGSSGGSSGGDFGGGSSGGDGGGASW